MPWKYILHLLSKIKYPKLSLQASNLRDLKMQMKIFYFSLKIPLYSKIVQSLVFISLYLYLLLLKILTHRPFAHLKTNNRLSESCT